VHHGGAENNKQEDPARAKITSMRSDRVCVVHPIHDRVEIHVPGKRRLFRKDLPDSTLSFTWHEVTRVVVFKRDCLTVDSIRMLFELNGTHTIELSEEMEG
jgi:hypothetical protein